MESPSKKSGSSAGRRKAVEFFCKLLSVMDAASSPILFQEPITRASHQSYHGKNAAG
jgi:hypothetical protein